MEKSTYNIYPADLPELIEAMQDGKYKHLSIFLYRDKSSLDMGFGQRYLMVNNTGFGLYDLRSVDYVIGKQKCSDNGNFNAVKTGTGIQ